ncbi:MAG: hypothetical protein WD648_08500 [Planctomycetaceae bacterium]
MADFLAIDWGRHEARYVLASAHGASLKVQAAGAVALADTEIDEETQPAVVARALGDALAPYKVGKTRTLVGIDRASIELHHLSLPPATDDELPLLVANQVARESSAATEESVIDFIAERAEPGAPRDVTAAVLSAAQLASIRKVCSLAGLNAHRLLLRPYATAALYAETKGATKQACLLVNVVDDEVDLTIVEDGKITFSRTVRVPEAAATERSYERLFAEISRTLLVAPQNKPGSGPVRSVLICGSAKEHGPLLELVRNKLDANVESFDPFAAVGGSPETVGGSSGRFTSLLGMIAVEARGGTQTIDFLHPRKQAPPRSYRKPLMAGAAVVAALVMAFGYSVWNEFATADAQISGLKEELDGLKQRLDRAGKKQAIVDSISDWQGGDVVWLDELRDLSSRFPPSRDLTVLRMSMSPARAGGGVITLQGSARGWTVVKRLEQDLRDEFHEVRIPHEQGRQQSDDYAWHFDTSIAVAKRTKEQYANPLAVQPEAKQGERDATKDENTTPQLRK